MKRILLLLSLSLAAATTAFAADVADRYVITTRQPAQAMRLRIMVNSDAVRRHDVRAFTNFNAFAATLTAEEVAELRKSGDVISVEPVALRQMSAITPGKVAADATLFSKQLVPWGLEAIHAQQVWPVTRGSKSVNVAILDTGIDDTHPDLKHAIAGQYDVYTRADRAYDDNRIGHGTHVAGIIAAADNTIGTVGIAPETRIWAVKVLNANGDGTDEAVALGLDWVISKKRELGGPWVVNFSLGAPRPSDVEKIAVKRALDEGIIIIAAAGNRSLAAVDYPAGYEGVIGIGALNPQNQLTDFSSFGTGLALTAPGVDLPSTVPIGRAKVAEVEIAGLSTVAYGTTGSPLATISGPMVFSGYGRPGDFPDHVAGKVAIIERGGNLYFGQKARNAKLAGATAVILVNDDDLVHDQYYGWNLLAQTCDAVDGCVVLPELAGFEFPLTVSVSRKEGAALLALAGRTVVTVSSRAEDYAVMGGTSMAAPHGSGTAALLLALDPKLTAIQLEFALITSSRDLGAAGWDTKFGYGAIDALAAAQYVAPARFGIEKPDPRKSPRRRAATQ